MEGSEGGGGGILSGRQLLKGAAISLLVAGCLNSGRFKPEVQGEFQDIWWLAVGFTRAFSKEAMIGIPEVVII